MSDVTWDLGESDVRDGGRRGFGPWRTGGVSHSELVTAEGAEWLATASAFPSSVRALWSARPGSPSVLPCGRAFDVVNLPVVFGRRVLDHLWESGPGCGPVAVHRGRMLVFAAPGTARRLPALLGWEEWGPLVPPMLCHGVGDAVTVPALLPEEAGAGAGFRGGAAQGAGGSRWLVAPGVREPWLPSAAVLLWACLRAARPAGALTGGTAVRGAGGRQV